MCMCVCFPRLSLPSRLDDKRVHSVLGLSTWARLFHSGLNGVNPLVSHPVSLSLWGEPGMLALATHTEYSKWASCRGAQGKKMIAKPNATASVWEYFGFKPNEQGEPINTDEPVCRICSKVVATNKKRQHSKLACLKNNHPTQFPIWGKKHCTSRCGAFVPTVNTHWGVWSAK